MKVSVESAATPGIEDLVFAFARFHAPACKIEPEAITDGLMLLAKNVATSERSRVIRSLAEKALTELDLYSHDRAQVADWLRSQEVK